MTNEKKLKDEQVNFSEEDFVNGFDSAIDLVMKILECADEQSSQKQFTTDEIRERINTELGYMEND